MHPNTIHFSSSVERPQVEQRGHAELSQPHATHRSMRSPRNASRYDASRQAPASPLSQPQATHRSLRFPRNASRHDASRQVPASPVNGHPTKQRYIAPVSGKPMEQEHSGHGHIQSSSVHGNQMEQRYISGPVNMRSPRNGAVLSPESAKVTKSKGTMSPMSPMNGTMSPKAAGKKNSAQMPMSLKGTESPGKSAYKNREKSSGKTEKNKKQRQGKMDKPKGKMDKPKHKPRPSAAPLLPPQCCAGPAPPTYRHI